MFAGCNEIATRMAEIEANGFLISSLLGFRYVEGINLPSIVVATLGAVILLAVLGGFQNRRTS